MELTLIFMSRAVLEIPATITHAAGGLGGMMIQTRMGARISAMRPKNAIPAHTAQTQSRILIQGLL